MAKGSRLAPIAVGVGYSAARAAGQASISLDEAIRQLTAQGLDTASVIAGLTRAMESGNGPLAQFRKQAKQAVTGLTSQRVSIETARRLSGGDPNVQGTWISTGASNVCPGCEKLHGTEMTEAEFERLHGTNECGANCYCFWMPGEAAVEASFAMRDVMNEHPEIFRNMTGEIPPRLMAERTLLSREFDGRDALVQKVVEHAAVVDFRGRVVGTAVGSTNHVRTPVPKNASECVATHNHPSGGSLSPADVRNLRSQGFAEKRAVGVVTTADGKTKKYLYRAALTKYSQVTGLTDGLWYKTYHHIERKPENSGLSWQELSHKVMQELASKLGFKYERTIISD